MNNPLSPSMAKFVLDVRSELGYYNSYSKVVSLLFLKYIIENSEKIGQSVDFNFKVILDFKTKMDKVIAGTYEFSLDDYEKILSVVDSQLVTFWGNSSFLFADFYRIYFDMFQKKGSDKKVFKSLNAVELPTNPNDWAEALKFLLVESYGDMLRTTENASSESMTKMVQALLNVNNSDTYLDPFCGLSTSLLNMRNPGKYIGYDIMYENVLVSYATALFMGIDSNNIEINYEDFLKSNEITQVDKIFADAPLNVRATDNIPKRYQDITKDFNVAVLLKIYDSLKDGGVAVIAAPGRTLFASQKGYEHFRKMTAENGLKAVITMPSLWARTMIDTNLIVIQKGYTGNVEFISAKDSLLKDRGRFIITDECVNTIMDHINNHKTEEGFSASIDRRDVICRGNWTPNLYTAVQIVKNESRPLDEINSDLDDLYKQFFDNNK